jgi:hypothetical protein
MLSKFELHSIDYLSQIVFPWRVEKSPSWHLAGIHVSATFAVWLVKMVGLEAVRTAEIAPGCKA